jgi:hypothetical protein
MGAMPKPASPRYRTTNWPEYNAALKRHGSLEIWFDPEMDWLSKPCGRSGRPMQFSDSAIELCLTLKSLFNLPLRQTTGLVASLIKTNAIGDAPVLPDLLTQIPDDEQISRVGGDGAYDTRKCHAAIAERGADAVIPVRRNGRPWTKDGPGVDARNEALRAMKRYAQQNGLVAPSGKSGVATIAAVWPRPKCTASSSSVNAWHRAPSTVR